MSEPRRNLAGASTPSVEGTITSSPATETRLPPVVTGSDEVPGAGEKATKAGDYRTFLANAIRRPSCTGAVLPTSPFLAKALAEVVPSTGQPVVVELGPGTGALSGAIQERLPSGARHVGIEVDPAMVRHLHKRKPWLEVIEGDATQLDRHLGEAGIDGVDAVVSGLPWSLFSDAQQSSILRQVGSALRPAGVFTTIAYLTSLPRAGAKLFRQRLQECFDEVLMTRTVWRNMPPARNYVCRRPATS